MTHQTSESNEVTEWDGTGCYGCHARGLVTAYAITSSMFDDETDLGDEHTVWVTVCADCARKPFIEVLQMSIVPGTVDEVADSVVEGMRQEEADERWCRMTDEEFQASLDAAVVYDTVDDIPKLEQKGGGAAA